LNERPAPETHNRDQPIPYGQPWRTGGHLGRTLFIGDRVIGMVDTLALANVIAALMNGGRPIGPDRRPMAAIGRNLYEAGLDVGHLDSVSLAMVIAETANHHYGHPDLPQPTRDPEVNAVFLVAEMLTHALSSPLGVAVDRDRIPALAARIVIVVRRADAYAADVTVSRDGPLVGCAAQALTARWGSEDGEHVQISDSARTIAQEALTAAAPSLLTAGGAAHLRRLADEEADFHGPNSRLVQYLRHAADQLDGTQRGVST
jgi:hypothetical protein